MQRFLNLILIAICILLAYIGNATLCETLFNLDMEYAKNVGWSVLFSFALTAIELKLVLLVRDCQLVSRFLCRSGIHHQWKTESNWRTGSTTRECARCGCWQCADMVNHRWITLVPAGFETAAQRHIFHPSYPEASPRYNPLGAPFSIKRTGKSRLYDDYPEVRLWYAQQYFRFYALTMFDLYDALEGKTLRIMVLFDHAAIRKAAETIPFHNVRIAP